MWPNGLHPQIDKLNTDRVEPHELAHTEQSCQLYSEIAIQNYLKWRNKGFSLKPPHIFSSRNPESEPPTGVAAMGSTNGWRMAGMEVPIFSTDSIKWHQVSVPFNSNSTTTTPPNPIAKDFASFCNVGDPPTYFIWWAPTSRIYLNIFRCQFIHTLATILWYLLLVMFMLQGLWITCSAIYLFFQAYIFIGTFSSYILCRFGLGFENSKRAFTTQKLLLNLFS